MESWLTPNRAVFLMLLGVVPSLVNIYLLYEDRYKPGVAWFLVSMVTGGAWALLFAMMTAIQSPRITLALANVFWAIVPVAAVSMFLLAYEFVFKKTVSRRVVVGLFVPIGALFVLTWFNPAQLVFGPEYYVDSDGILHLSLGSGVFRVLVVQVYGYLLVFLAAGMFVGEAMRTSGTQRRQTIYLLVLFSALVGSTGVKVANLVPMYYDPTSTVYALSGVLFAYSINKHGLLKLVPVAREQAFEEIEDVIAVVDPTGTIVDLNREGRRMFGSELIGTPVGQLLPDRADDESIALNVGGERRCFTVRESSVDYGRGLGGKILVLSDISTLKEREEELNLLKEIFSRVFRHNIRNDLTLIDGYAELIARQSDDDVAELAAGIRTKASHLVNQSKKMRRIEEVLTRSDTVTGTLPEVVQQAISAARSTGDFTVRSNVEDALVEYHPRFNLAVQELIENAINHHDTAEPPEIDIYTESTTDTVTLVIEDDGPGIPQSEINVLHAERETDLEHGSGVGLWLVRWIVIHSNGELTATATDSGARVSIQLSRATVEDGPD